VVNELDLRPGNPGMNLSPGTGLIVASIHRCPSIPSHSSPWVDGLVPALGLWLGNKVLSAATRTAYGLTSCRNGCDGLFVIDYYVLLLRASFLPLTCQIVNCFKSEIHRYIHRSTITRCSWPAILYYEHRSIVSPASQHYNAQLI
jgi:hypothetical protein